MSATVIAAEDTVVQGADHVGLTIRRMLTKIGVHPFDTVEWERRDARIGHGDKVAFEQLGVEFPKTWSQNATNIVAQKYFRGQMGSEEREFSVREMIGRVAVTIADWGRERGYFASPEDAKAFEDELTHILLYQMAAFNSPVWFNVGFEDNPQCSACFILSVEDHLEDILEWNTQEGHIFRGGSGSGINLSKIRASKEPLRKGGTASGPVSFMRGADAWAGTIKSGGKTRRAAKMVVLNIDHPDIREFIWCKAIEEKKANALRDAGFDMSIDGDGFISIQYQNANNSVRLTDAFMQAVRKDEDWHLTARVTGNPVGEPIKARELMREIAEAAHQCADPGVQYDTTINRWHTSPNSGRINASNPCSEYMHVDDSACNLASLNLMKFRRPDGTFDVPLYEHVIDILFLAQDITVGTEEQPASSFPTEKIGENARAFRQIGLGYANLGAYLMSNGMPYDSDEGRAAAAAMTALMTGRAYARSAEIAGAMGPYDRYAENREPHNAVMRMHRDATHVIDRPHSRDEALLDASIEAWVRAVELGDRHGYRNAQATVLAPTGTISFLMDCDTTGVEPDFSLVKFKELVGGGQMTIVNQRIPMALATLGYTPEQVGIIGAYVEEEIPTGEVVDGVAIKRVRGTIIGAPGLKDEHLPVFDVSVGARAISHMGHIRMMAAVQPFISGAISKTVNLPHEATVEDIADAFMQAWELGVKAVAIYRDGSKTAQAIRTDAQMGKGEASDPHLQARVDELEQQVIDLLREIEKNQGPVRRRMPTTRESRTHKFVFGGHEGYITVGMYTDGTPGEIFLTDIGKEGSTLRGMTNAFATSFSIMLQYGVPLETLVQKFSYMRFEPEGITENREIPFTKSIPDYIVKWLATQFLDRETQVGLGINVPDEVSLPIPTAEVAQATKDEVAAEREKRDVKLVETFEASVGIHGMPTGVACTQCGGEMRRTGSCYTCGSCGENTGCG